VLVNMSPDAESARDVFTRLHAASDHFLSGVSLDYLGFIPRDPSVRKAVINQTPFCVADPAGAASRALGRVAKTIQTWNTAGNLDGNIKFFWKKLLFRS
jgi:flagellar biosynthesis protein FlhG